MKKRKQIDRHLVGQSLDLLTGQLGEQIYWQVYSQLHAQIWRQIDRQLGEHVNGHLRTQTVKDLK